MRAFPATAPAAPGGWNRFWFTPADPATLGLVRIFAGLAALAIHFAYCFDLQEFFGRDAWLNLPLANEVRREAPVTAPPSGWQDTLPQLPDFDPQRQSQVNDYVRKWGVHPDLAHSQGNYAWSLWFHVTDSAAMRWLHGGALAVMLLFTLGFCTRLTSALTWLAALSYVHRAPTTLFGMDQIMAVLLLYLTIGPGGAALSLDAFLARRGLSWERLFGGRPAPPGPSVSANVALRLMQVHFAIVYAAAGLSKLLGGTWWSGTALWWTVANYEFTPLRYPAYAGALRWLCDHRLMWELVMGGGVAYTLALEIAFPFLVWRPRWRGLMVSGAVLLHTAIALVMGLVGFGLCMLALVLAFVPGEVVRHWLGQKGEREEAPTSAEGDVLSRAA